MSKDQIKILLVDDREDNLLSMELVLEKEGYSFSKATSGKDALKILLKEQDFSLILLDVKMPIMDGYETAAIIYEREKLRNIPIIFITGQDYEDSSVFKGYQYGAVDYIRKPVNPQILRSKVAVFSELFKKNQLLKLQEERLRSINEELLHLNQDLEERVKQRTLELEKANAELKELNISKDKFLSVISHDLRNPLTALLVSSEKLYAGAENHTPKNITTLSTIIHSTSKKILQQLNELVDWAKKQQDKTNFKPESIHLFNRMNESLELLNDNAFQKQINLQNLVPKNIYVSADSQMLRSILQNVVTNAIKYTSHGGCVKVTAQPLQSMIEVCVEDSGVGMSPETRDKLFATSFSSSISGTDNEKGSGLGLLLVKDFVAQHGGSIHIESSIGVGTTVKFTIPGNEIEETR
ncbi:hybrid sensor histidine kinase/response regulator [Flavihumibacter sp. R14]|nr:hybrid sensor histidine kinase/response regulator [Flavihumibacter soli]